MEARSPAVVLALIAAPVAIFRRRNKHDWLGELDEIRDDALGGSGDEIGAAMASAPEPGGAAGIGGLRRGEGPAGHDAGVSSTGHGQAGSVGGVLEAPAGTEPPPPPPAVPVAVHAGGAATATSVPRPPRPTPHRDRPSELWHAPLDLGASVVPPQIGPEECVGSADVVGPSTAGTDLFAERSGPAQVDSGPVQPLSPPLEAFAGSDLQEPSPAPGRPAGEGRSRIRPPTDIFDVAPAVGADPVAPAGAPTRALRPVGTGTPGGLVGAPVGRRPTRATTQRSLFGGGTGLPAQKRPATERVEISDLGEVVDDRGTIRFAERTRPEITRSPTDDSFALESGWCWVARASAVPPVRIELPVGVLVIPGTTRTLVVVEADRSTFVSVVSGAAHLEHQTGLIPLAAGSVSHTSIEGPVSVDAASPDEMAADAILTRNLRMDDALDAITSLARKTAGS